jgi:hypothetical protein
LLQENLQSGAVAQGKNHVKVEGLVCLERANQVRLAIRYFIAHMTRQR